MRWDLFCKITFLYDSVKSNQIISFRDYAFLKKSLNSTVRQKESQIAPIFMSNGFWIKHNYICNSISSFFKKFLTPPQNYLFTFLKNNEAIFQENVFVNPCSLYQFTSLGNVSLRALRPCLTNSSSSQSPRSSRNLSR